MPRRHQRIYHRTKHPGDALADIERVLHESENAAVADAPPPERPSIDYQPFVAVIDRDLRAWIDRVCSYTARRAINARRA
jgi:hypothetical protein